MKQTRQTTSQAEHFYTPVFERLDGTRFIYTSSAFACGTEQQARMMGITADLCRMSAMTQSRWVGEVHRVVRGDRTRPYARGSLGGMGVALLQGPLFDKAIQMQTGAN